jgi:formylglycine-generating enzyme required for sulfatase activity
MRTLMLLALAVALCGACADEPAPDDATPTEPVWLTDRPENAHPYTDDTLARFGKFVEGDVWGDVTWNEQGTLEVVHELSGLSFVLVPAGTFMMGSEDGEEDEKPVHRVSIPAFLLCRTECTAKAWGRVEGDDDANAWAWGRVEGEDDKRRRGERLPVGGETWFRVKRWCQNVGLRLPSEAEWEYACRAGTTTRYSAGDGEADLDRVGWYIRNSEGRAHSVGEKPANAFGLHDMHGNVWEWCEDTWVKSYEGAPADGSARVLAACRSNGAFEKNHLDLHSEGRRRRADVGVREGHSEYSDWLLGGQRAVRVMRGASYNCAAGVARSAHRLWYKPNSGGMDLGFRPAADLPR